nr:hypothetical protein [uncultured Holophaga sp.]
MSRCFALLFPAALVAAAPLMAQAPEAHAPAPSFSVVGGYLVAQLPQEGVTVVARPADPKAEDSGWATWAQRGDLLWRGEMTDSQGRHYNVRILPGYVAPLEHGERGWSLAGSDLAEYGQARTWKRLGRASKSTFQWGWEDAFWDFGVLGTGRAWRGNFALARSRVGRKTFGWPLAYPWAVLSASFESLLRLPLGVAGAGVGTAGATVVPVVGAAWPAAKAGYHAGVDGVLLPVAGWTWQSLAAPPAALLASAPAPGRADGRWMTVDMGPAPQVAPRPALSEEGLGTLAAYGAEVADLDRGDRALRLAQEEEMAALRKRHTDAWAAQSAARSSRLQAWVADPSHRAAMEGLLAEGGDSASLRAEQDRLVTRLQTLGLSERDARELLSALIRHPLRSSAPVTPARMRAKTDPVQGALDTVHEVTGVRVGEPAAAAPARLE